MNPPVSEAQARRISLERLATARQRAQFRTGLSRWFERHGRDLPWRRTRDPYAIMVSEFMLQQTQVATVVPYYDRWMEKFPTFQALAAASEADVLASWQGLGYYSRARNLHRASQQVVAEHGGSLPMSVEEIGALPGVGRYTAGALASFAFDQAVVTIDANIARVLARLSNLSQPVDEAAGAAALREFAAALLPGSGGCLHTSSLMELGALVCTPAKPQCPICPVRKFCAAENPGLLPIKKPRRKVVELEENCAWIFDGARFLLEQQTGSRWRGLWKLPLWNGEPFPQESLLRATYPFTHHRVTLSVFSAPPPARVSPAQQWFSIAALDSAAMPSPHRRAVEALVKSFAAPPARA